jgi:hypothetical protein
MMKGNAGIMINYFLMSYSMNSNLEFINSVASYLAIKKDVSITDPSVLKLIGLITIENQRIITPSKNIIEGHK